MAVTCVLTFIALTALAVARPLENVYLSDQNVLLPDKNFIWEQPITETLLPKLSLYAQYAAASYCPANYGTSNTRIQCGGQSGACPLVEDAGAMSHSEFTKSKWTDVTGFVAFDPKNENVVVSFRGSASLKNWLADFTFKSVPSDLCPKCEVHKGFWAAWTEARPSVLPAVQDVLNKHPNYTLVVTGHSLGGAVATLAAADLRKQGHWVDLYTFGAPRVALKYGAKYLATGLKRGRTFRITNLDDPVPRLPPSKFGYRQTFPEYHILADNIPTTVADMIFYKKPIAPKGLSNWKMDTKAHIVYFGNISRCDFKDAELIVPLTKPELQDLAKDASNEENNFSEDLLEFGVDGLEAPTDPELANATMLTHMGKPMLMEEKKKKKKVFSVSNVKDKFKSWKALKKNKPTRIVII